VLSLRSGQITAPAEHVGKHRLCAAHIAAPRDDRAKLPLCRAKIAALDRRPRGRMILAHGTGQRRSQRDLCSGSAAMARDSRLRLGHVA
jgi:hypothetical protein